MDLRLNRETHDLEVVDGDLVICDPADAARQDVHIRLRTTAGEWFLDTNEGIPYFTRIFGQRPSTLSLLEIFRNAVLKSPYVAALKQSNIQVFDGTLHVSFEATLSDGSSLHIQETLEANRVLGF